MSNIVNGFDFGALPIKTTFVGKVEDKEWPHYLWNVVITHKDGFWTVPYKTGLGLVFPSGKPMIPTNADIMYSLLLDMSATDQSFNDWCSEYGYNNDSLTVLNTYQTCCEYAAQMKKTFTREQLEAMQKALEDY